MERYTSAGSLEPLRPIICIGLTDGILVDMDNVVLVLFKKGSLLKWGEYEILTAESDGVLVLSKTNGFLESSLPIDIIVFHSSWKDKQEDFITQIELKYLQEMGPLFFQENIYLMCRSLISMMEEMSSLNNPVLSQKRIVYALISLCSENGWIHRGNRKQDKIQMDLINRFVVLIDEQFDGKLGGSAIRQNFDGVRVISLPDM